MVTEHSFLNILIFRRKQEIDRNSNFLQFSESLSELRGDLKCRLENTGQIMVKFI